MILTTEVVCGGQDVVAGIVGREWTGSLCFCREECEATEV